MADDDPKELPISIYDEVPAALVNAGEKEPPVVARMIIEIRSDGTRTIARGAMEDLLSGEKVAIEAHGRTPLHLALGLAKSIAKGRSFAKTAVRALLPGSKNKP